MAKLEFIKETKKDGTIFYFTKIDGKHSNGSISLNEEEGLSKYNAIRSGYINAKKEILKSEEI
jgi:hypothetical protein